MNRQEKLRQFFRRNRIADKQKLFQILGTTSSMTVFRCLKQIGYLTSYSHAGAYYTLEAIPRFNEEGLWKYHGTCFSGHGTLKATIPHAVERSPLGMTSRELEILLGVRVQNTLRELINERLVSRLDFEGMFVYLSKKKRQASIQMSKRKCATKKVQPSPLDPGMTIEILIELLRSDDWDAKYLSGQLLIRGIRVKAALISSVMKHYHLKKKGD